ncbi:hypothetical protein [Chitinophaga rhizophila]|uniref:2TM domain-containing protein n=1 Tax=Chitinophaga rhizophila TaxID=2866212 RepID=A0ABS7G987_9BACT|nr:hypothetical protein [Chitinophaga rhizophila]MBW8683083.1 hypothetical protein [Chitinophaga rhizophila]
MPVNTGIPPPNVSRPGSNLKLICFVLLASVVLLCLMHFFGYMANNIAWPYFIAGMIYLPGLFLHVLVSGLRFTDCITEESYIKLTRLIYQHNIKDFSSFIKYAMRKYKS